MAVKRPGLETREHRSSPGVFKWLQVLVGLPIALH